MSRLFRAAAKGFPSDEDFDYTWYYFDQARNFYELAAKAGRPVVFTVDQ